MLRATTIFLALVFQGKVQSQPIVPSISPAVMVPSVTTSTVLTPTVSPAIGGVSTTLPTLAGVVPSTVLPPTDLATAPFTFPPVLANFPTPPAGNNVCYVCGKGYQVANKTSLVELSQVMYTCEQVEYGGLRQLIPNIFCIQAFQEKVTIACGCVAEPESAAPSAAPVDQNEDKGNSAGTNVMNWITFSGSLILTLLTTVAV
jgi:hypothetical protein